MVLRDRPVMFFCQLLFGSMVIFRCDNAVSDSSIYKPHELTSTCDANTFEALYGHYLLQSLWREDNMTNSTTPDSRSLHLSKGIVQLDGEAEYSIQVLGFEESMTGKWTWGWSDDVDVKNDLRHAARDIKAFGGKRKIREFTEETYILEDFDVYMLALTAVGLCDAEAFLHLPYRNGRITVLLFGKAFPLLFESECYSLFLMATTLEDRNVNDHKAAVIAFCKHRALKYEGKANTLIVRDPFGDLTIQFDEKNRIDGDPTHTWRKKSRTLTAF